MTQPTHAAISPDSGTHWTEPGAWDVSPTTYRIPLPLPNDGLRAINVYVVVGADGLTLIDGGWALEASRKVLQTSLGAVGFALADIRRFLVTHAHRDHYTQAITLRRELGAEVWLGAEEEPGFEAMRTRARAPARNPQVGLLREAGAPGLAGRWQEVADSVKVDLSHWELPDGWLTDGQELDAGERHLTAISTPGHTRGHYVFADHGARDLFAGDHVLPTITPSIGFEAKPPPLPLGDFIRSLEIVRDLPDARLLPAHGPIAPSSHTRVDQLLQHHDARLEACLAALPPGGATAADVAASLPWTRHAHDLAALDPFNAGLAVLETRAHLDLLVHRGRALVSVIDDVLVYAPAGSASP